MLIRALTRVSIFLAVAGCSAAPVATERTHPDGAAADFGLTIQNAINVCKPQGQQEYLSLLVCPDGQHPAFDRIGSVGLRNEPPENASRDEVERRLVRQMTYEPLGPNDTDFHMVDAYRLQCGDRSTTVYLDMYHCGEPMPQKAPNGFTHL